MFHVNQITKYRTVPYHTQGNPCRSLSAVHYEEKRTLINKTQGFVFVCFFGRIIKTFDCDRSFQPFRLNSKPWIRVDTKLVR